MYLVNETDYGTPASKSEKTVTLTIDGMKVSAPEGTTVMRAAAEAGNMIPKLCATDMVKEFGSCRRRDRGARRHARIVYDAGR
jgi:formate dehydrogenase major subunit